MIKLTQYNGIKNRYKSILHESSNDNDDTSIGDIKNSIKQEISDIINMYMQKCSENVPLSSVNPGVLIENSFLLSKVGFYEEIMEEYLNACTSLEEVVQLEKVDGYLRKFISSERKSRSRLKINYLMAGAVSNRFEEAVQTLSDWLVIYIHIFISFFLFISNVLFNIYHEIM